MKVLMLSATLSTCAPIWHRPIRVPECDDVEAQICARRNAGESAPARRPDMAGREVTGTTNEQPLPLRASDGTPELSRRDAVLLHLDVQRLVVGSEEPRRLTLVPLCVPKRSADGELFGVRSSRIADLLQRVADRGSFFSECSGRRRVGVEEREVLRLNHIRRSQDGSPNDVAELTHVPRPGVVQKALRCRF